VVVGEADNCFMFMAGGLSGNGKSFSDFLFCANFLINSFDNPPS